MKFANRTILQDDVERALSRLDDSAFTLIYLDPPWGTSREWEGDVNTSTTGEYERFLVRVVQNCRRLLADNGSIYVHAPPASSVHHRLILDQIFQKSPSLVIVWKNLTRRRLPASLGAHSHEDILRYTKTDASVYNSITAPRDMSAYGQSDARGPYRLLDATAGFPRKSLTYLWRGFEPPSGRSWRFTPERMEQYFAEGRIVIPKAGRPRIKQYFDESIGEDIGTVWDNIPPVSSPRIHCGGREKPPELVSRIVRQGSNEGDWILDPFLGSGSFLVGAEKLNRKWIGCNNDTTSVAVCRERFIRETCLLGQEVTFVEARDLAGFEPVTTPEANIFVSIPELMEARSRLAQIAGVISEIRAGLQGKELSDEDVLDAMLKKSSGVTLVVSLDAHKSCQGCLSAEIPWFNLLSQTSKDFLVTALFTLKTLQDSLDFSFVSLGAWKAVELEMASKIFSPFKEWFARRHPNVANAVASDSKNSKTAKIASFLKGTKDMSLGDMRWNLDLLAKSRETIKSSLCLQELKAFVTEYFTRPEFFFNPTELPDLISQENIDRYRNGAAHTTLFTKAKAEDSFNFVKSLLSRLMTGFLAKDFERVKRTDTSA